MANVFLQDSDDDDSAVLKEKPKPVLRRPILNESDDDSQQPDAHEEEERNVLVDSDSEDDTEEKIADIPKVQSAHVTDESSPDVINATKGPSKKSKGSSWTIPKKKIAPVKSSLIPSAPPPEENNSAPSRPVTSKNTENTTRIPRKKLGASSPESKSLLLTEPLATTSSPQVPNERRKSQGASTIPSSETHPGTFTKANPQRNPNFPVSRSNGHEMDRGERSAGSATVRKDISSTVVSGIQTNRDGESRTLLGGSERAKNVDEHSRDRGHRTQNTFAPPARSDTYSTNVQREKSRDHWDVYRPEKPRDGMQYRQRHEEPQSYRDRHRGEQRSDGYRRDGFGHENSRRNYDNDHPRRGQANNMSWNNQPFSPTRYDGNGSSRYEAEGSHSSRHPDNYIRNRYDSYHTNYAHDGSPVRRQERFQESSMENPESNGASWKREDRSRDRFERGSSRNYDNAPEYAGYDRYGGRPYRKQDDEYRYRSRDVNHHEEEENYRYHGSPAGRDRYRPRKSRDRSRDRTRDTPTGYGFQGDPPSEPGHVVGPTTANVRQEVRYNSANFDEEEFLGGNRASKGNRRDNPPRPMEGEGSPRSHSRGYHPRMLEEYN